MQELESNRIRAMLPSLQQHAQIVRPEYGAVLIEQHLPSDQVFFPMKGAVLSLTRSVASGTQVEVGVIGFEGIGGIGSVLDPRRNIDRGIVQAAVAFAVVPLAIFNEE